MTTTRPSRGYGGVSAEDRIAQRRERLLDAGLELFGTHGYGATGVKDVCREAGLTDRYFYESFGSSGELFVAVFDRVVDDLFASVALAAVEAGEDPQEQLRAAIGIFVGTLAADPRKTRLVFGEADAAGPAAAAHMRTTLRRFAGLVAATARRHLPPQTPDEDVQLVAFSLVGLLERVLSEHIDGELDMPLDVVVERSVTLYTELLLAVAARAG
jgi:AcrR family transcriptional regulator